MGINFPASPIVGQKYPQPAIAGIPVYTWDGEKWTTVGGSIAAYAPPADAVPLMDATPGLVGTTTEYAREDHVHPTDTTRASVTALDTAITNATGLMAYSGMQINGGMEVSQELGGSAVAVANSARYSGDGWKILQAGTMLAAAGTGPSTLFTANGLSAHTYVSISTAQPSLGAGDYVLLQQPIEGYRISRLAWGTANAKPITISFWSKHIRTGVYSVAVRGPGGTDRSYATTYTHAASDVSQYNTVTVPGCADSTWQTTNSTGLFVEFAVACGATYSAPSANTWLTGSYSAAPGQVNAAAATSDVFRITGVTVLPGTQAPTAAQSPNIMRPYGDEVAICQRYYETLIGLTSGSLLHSWNTGGIANYQYWKFAVTKRVGPTMVFLNGSSWAGSAPTADANIDGILLFSVVGHFYASIAGGLPSIAADARL